MWRRSESVIERSAEPAPAPGSFAEALAEADEREGRPFPRRPGDVPRLPQIGRWRYMASVAIWLLFLFSPLSAYYSQPHGIGAAIGTGVLFLGFATAYVLGHAWPSDQSTTLRNAWPLALLTVLAVALAAVIGAESFPGLCIFLASVVGNRFRGKAGLRITLALTAAAAIAVVSIHDYGELLYAVLIVFVWWGVFGMRHILRVNTELRDAREEVADLRVTAERERVARDVHDVLGHSLTVISIKAQVVERLLEPTDEAASRDPRLEKARGEIAEIEALTRNALADVRATVGGIRAPGLASTLGEARAALDTADIALVVVGSSADVEDRATERLFAWVLREAVTNIIRHSEATECRVRIEPGSITIYDDGRGVPPSEHRCDGNGLRGIAERAHGAGADVDVRQKNPGRSRPGTVLRVALRGADSARPATEDDA